MNVLAINGSPRKKWNTATLLGKALEGAASLFVFSYADPEERRERRRTVFPEDCRKAFALGARLAQKLAQR